MHKEDIITTLRKDIDDEDKITLIYSDIICVCCL